MKLELLTFLAMGVFVASDAYAAPPPKTECQVDAVTIKAFHEGMTYPELVGVFGCEGALISGSLDANSPQAIYQWSGNGPWPASYVRAVFAHGKSTHARGIFIH